MTSEHSKTPRFGVLTVSDRASSGDYEDRSGPAMQTYLNRVISSDFEVDARIIPDEEEGIAETLLDMVRGGADLVLVSGGTGPAPRDVTPEALARVADKELPGFGELMRKVSLEQVPTAILSRQTAAIVEGALVVLLPGKPRAIDVCLDAVFPAIPYCIDLVGGAYIETSPDQIEAFRPKNKKPAG